MAATPQWVWSNLRNGLEYGEASRLEAAFFQGSAPIELYRDVFYCTAGTKSAPQACAMSCRDVHLKFGGHARLLGCPSLTRLLGCAPTESAVITPAGVILLFGLLAVVFRKFDVGSYRSLSDASRLIFISHNVFFLIFLLTAIPYSFAMVSVLFAPSAPRNLLESSVYRSISFPLALQVVMYALEVRLDVHGKRCSSMHRDVLTAAALQFVHDLSQQRRVCTVDYACNSRGRCRMAAW